jgi:hypothetical protein
VQDRLGKAPAGGKDTTDLHTGELYSLTRKKGHWPMAVVRQFIDGESGLLEMISRDKARGAVLFHCGQVWPRGPHGGTATKGLEAVLHLGQQVHVNVRRVESGVAALQATVVWPLVPGGRAAGPPRYRLQLGQLEQQVERARQLARQDLVPLCVNGVRTRVIAARVKRVLDDNWGLVEVKLVGSERDKESSRRFLCVFHKFDVWLVIAPRGTQGVAL